MSLTFKNDLTGRRFGRLTVLSFVEKPNTRNTYWLCRCDCEKEKVINGQLLLRGITKSCGCLKESLLCTNNFKHGLIGTRLYATWGNMNSRCNNPKNKAYKHYGGKGIKVCDEWKNNFKAFYDWAMSNGYEEHLTIDRINVDKGYFPENCRWADEKTQKRNMSTNVIIEYNGQNMCLAEASEKSGINYGTLKDRYRKGLRGDDLFKKVNK